MAKPPSSWGGLFFINAIKLNRTERKHDFLNYSTAGGCKKRICNASNRKRSIDR